MEIRTPQQASNILNHIKYIWDLSLLEEEVLERILSLLAEQNYYELNKLEL